MSETNNQIYPSRKPPYTFDGVHIHIARRFAKFYFRDFLDSLKQNVRTFKYDIRVKRHLKLEDGRLNILDPQRVSYLLESPEFGNTFNIILVTEEECERYK